MKCKVRSNDIKSGTDLQLWSELKKCRTLTLFFKVYFSLGKWKFLSRVWLFVTPWTVACQDSLFITTSQNLLKLMSFESVMPSNHLILCHPFLLLPSIFPSIRVFSNESVLFTSGGQVIQVYALTSNAEEVEVEQFFEDLQDLLELTPKKDVLFIIGD